ncbi:MAG: flagellar biosynthesis anti-sigma factor FlgM [Cellulosilyticaceae bacterium]
MRIDKLNQINKLYGAQTTMPQVKPMGKMGKDKVSFSETGKDIQFACKIAKELPDVRQDKIDEIKARMRSGNYNVDAKQVSEKIVSQLDLRG